MRELRFKDPDELREKIQAYLDRCAKAGELPAWTELAVELGTNRVTLDSYVEAALEGGGKKARCGEVIAWARTVIESQYEKAMVNSYSKGVEAVLRQFYKGWEAMADRVEVKGGVSVEHKGEVRTPASQLTDEELMKQLSVLMEKAKLIRRKEGVTDGADGQ